MITLKVLYATATTKEIRILIYATTTWPGSRTALQEIINKKEAHTPLFLFTTPTGIHGPWHGDEHTFDVTYTPGGHQPAVKKFQLSPTRVAKAMMNLSSGEKHHMQGLMQIDHHVGQILDMLEQRGMRQNTLIIFTL